MSVLTLAGKAINWDKPPKATARVMWSQRTSGGKMVTGSLRSIAHLDHLNTLAIKKFGRGLVVLQSAYNTGVAASAGTHDYDACFDVYIPGVGWTEQETFFRANGAGAYHREPPSFGHHIHYFCLPPREGSNVSDDYRSGGFKVGKYVDGGWSTAGKQFTSSQIGDYYSVPMRNALSGHGLDDGYKPPSIPATIFNLNAYIKARQVAKVPAHLDILVGHASMQFSDTPAQWKADAEKVFKRGYQWITGTEAGETDNYTVLKAAAKKYGYAIRHFRSNWIAVKRSIIKAGSFKWGTHVMAKAAEVAGPGHDTSYLWITFVHKTKGVGTISVVASHYPTKGQWTAKDPARRVNVKWTKLAGKETSAKVASLAKGAALGFYGGDQNLPDNLVDTFSGGPVVSCWDELKKYPSTGHGTIDVIGRHKGDGRVKCIRARAFKDADLALHMDHFLIEATYRVRLAA